MSELVAFSNKSIILTTGKGSYSIFLPDVVSVEEAFETGFVRVEGAFTVRLVKGGQVVVYAIDAEEATAARETLMGYWDSYLRHNEVYENSSQPPKTTLLKGNRLQVTWGGNTVVLRLNELEGLKLDNKSLRAIYPDDCVIFASDMTAFLATLKSGIEAYLKGVEFD